jgi:hypothetical protein
LERSAADARGPFKFGLVGRLLAGRQAGRVGLRRQHGPALGRGHGGAARRAARGPLRFGQVGRCNERLGLMVGSEDEVLVNDAASAIGKLIRLADKIDTKLSGVPVV